MLIHYFVSREIINLSIILSRGRNIKRCESCPVALTLQRVYPNARVGVHHWWREGEAELFKLPRELVRYTFLVDIAIEEGRLIPEFRFTL
jgi:hypothetical protein